MEIIKKIEQVAKDKNNITNMVDINISENPSYSANVLLESILNIPKMEPLQREYFIESYFYKILELTSSPVDKPYLNIWLSIEFLESFLAVLKKNITFTMYSRQQQKLNIQQNNIIQINNLLYNILTMPENVKPDNYNSVITYVGNISSITNSAYIPHLEAMGLPKFIAEYISLIRFSSFNIETIIKRLNFFFINQSKEIMTEDMLTNILKYLFMSDYEWHVYLQVFMFDVIPEYGTVDWVTQDTEEIDSTLNLAVLNVLQSRGYNTAYIAIRDYSLAYKYYNRPIRFSFRSISGDYQMLRDIVNNIDIQSNGEFYVP